MSGIDFSLCAAMDDVYIVDINGVYYLVDAVHPGVQLQWDVVL